MIGDDYPGLISRKIISDLLEFVDSNQGLSCGDYPGSAKIILKLTIVEFFNQRLDGFSEINQKIFEFEA